jgi:hypothetical protein
MKKVKLFNRKLCLNNSNNFLIKIQVHKVNLYKKMNNWKNKKKKKKYRLR